MRMVLIILLLDTSLSNSVLHSWGVFKNSATTVTLPLAYKTRVTITVGIKTTSNWGSNVATCYWVQGLVGCESSLTKLTRHADSNSIGITLEFIGIGY